MNTNVQAQWADLHKQEKAARSAGQWAKARNLQKQIVALKPALQASLTKTPLPPSMQPQTTSKTEQPTTTKTKTQPAPRFTDYDFYLYPASQSAQMFANRIVDEWMSYHRFRRAVKPEVLRAYQFILEGIAMNLLYAHITDHAGVMVTRDRGRGVVASKRYSPEAYTPERFLTVLDELKELHLLAQTIGDKWKRDWSKVFGLTKAQFRGLHLKRTQLALTENLKALMQEVNVGGSTEEIGFNRERQEVILLKKDSVSELVDYPDDATTRKYRKQMNRVNRMLEEAGPLLAPEYNGSIDPRQRFLERKFLYESFEKGGRLCGGFWQSELKREDRPQVLRIQGQPTAELDFKNMGLRLAYIFTGQEPPEGDLYAIPGLHPESRAGIKIVVNALFFDEEKGRTRFPVDEDGVSVANLFHVEDRVKGFGYVLECIKKAHAPVTDLFDTGVGYHLQFLESQVMVNALLMIARSNRVALPLNDGVVVAEREAEFIRLLMEWTTERVLGTRIPVEMKEPEGQMVA